MANFTDVLGSLMEEGLSPTTMDRLKEALGSGGALPKDDLGNLLGKLGLDTSSLGDIIGGLFGGGKGAEGIGRTLSSTLEEAQKAIGSDKKLALAALGALAGAILGGGSKSMKGAVGGGLLAVLRSSGLPGSERDSARIRGSAFNP